MRSLAIQWIANRRFAEQQSSFPQSSSGVKGVLRCPPSFGPVLRPRSHFDWGICVRWAQIGISVIPKERKGRRHLWRQIV
jgi:hypothetical protein